MFLYEGMDQHFLANAFPCSLSEEALRKAFSSQWSEDFTAVQVGFPPSGELNAEWHGVGGVGGGTTISIFIYFTVQ